MCVYQDLFVCLCVYIFRYIFIPCVSIIIYIFQYMQLHLLLICLFALVVNASSSVLSLHVQSWIPSSISLICSYAKKKLHKDIIYTYLYVCLYFILVIGPPKHKIGKGSRKTVVGFVFVLGRRRHPP